MSLRTKLIVVTLFVALVPLLVSAVTTLRIHQSAFETSLNNSQRRAAKQSSITVHEILSGALRQFARAAQALPWSQLSDEELRGALNILYQQDDGIAVVAIFDEKGNSVVESVFVEPGDGSKHPSGSTALRARLYQSSPMKKSEPGASTIGTAFVGDDGRTVLAPILTTVRGRDAKPWIVAYAWSIEPICRVIRDDAYQTTTLLGDPQGRRLCASPKEVPLSKLPEGLMQGLSSTTNDEIFSYVESGTRYAAVSARPSEDWLLVVQQPIKVAQAPSKRMFKQSIFWLGAGLVIAIAAGLFLAQGISGRVQVLTKGAEVLGAGDLSYRITEEGGDELSRLGASFNNMGAELEKRQAEIEAWNLTLQQKVEQRTHELENAQQQLLESQKITAVSSLAAGLAHEINNPLTGVLGLTQLLKNRFSRQAGNERVVKSLSAIETQAVRIREIVQSLQNLSDEESSGVEAVAPEDFVRSVYDLASQQALEENVDLRVELAEGLPDFAGNATELRRAFMHLVKNSLAACSESDRIVLAASALGDELIKFEVRDTGSGIPKEHHSRVFEPFFTTKKEWGGKGLGATEAYRIIQQQNGRIELHSQAGTGTIATVFMPVYRRGAHLV